MIDAAYPPRVVWSLDFELRWGMHDRLGMNLDGYRRNLEGALEAVPELLDLFDKHGVRATWATVGALGCESWEEYFRYAPPPPRYDDMRLAVTSAYADLDPDGRLHFAPHLVRRIAQARGQDLGGHTFSHIFLGELGVMQRDAEADHMAITKLFQERFSTMPTSLVFPRNQVAFLRYYQQNGITAWRGNEASWYFRMTQHSDHLLVRSLRLADGLIPFLTRGGGDTVDGHTNSTLFIRVYLPEIAWRIHLAKIRTEARRMKCGSVLHFWLHPHNLGANVRLGIRRLEQTLEVIEKNAPDEFCYTSMKDVAIQITQ